MESSYIEAYRSGVLQKRVEKANAKLQKCTLCPRKCGVDRTAGERGVCNTGKLAEVASYTPHFGEERVLVGENGSGTIFFCGCNLLCSFCQNFEISRAKQGECTEVTDEQLAWIMLELQKQGCHNINFVTPSHVIPQILSALLIAVEKGLNVPLVYNSSGYDEVESLKLLDGIVDIYMPDCKFSKDESAKRYCKAPNYPDKVRMAMLEMQNQVGNLQISKEGLAEKGMLVRHLLMPDGMAETKEILTFIAIEISLDCYINIMDQYRPCGDVVNFPELQRCVTAEEHQTALALAEDLGLRRIDDRDISNLLKFFMGR